MQTLSLRCSFPFRLLRLSSADLLRSYDADDNLLFTVTGSLPSPQFFTHDPDVSSVQNMYVPDGGYLKFFTDASTVKAGFEVLLMYQPKVAPEGPNR